MNSLNKFTTYAEEKLYDICMIDRLCHGNQAQVNKMVSVFIKEIPTAMEEIKLAYHNKDLIAVKDIAHRIKPTLSYYAIIKAEKHIQQIEIMAKNGESSPALDLSIQNLQTILTTVVRQLKNNYL